MRIDSLFVPPNQQICKYNRFDENTVAIRP